MFRLLESGLKVQIIKALSLWERDMALMSIVACCSVMFDRDTSTLNIITGKTPCLPCSSLSHFLKIFLEICGLDFLLNMHNQNFINGFYHLKFQDEFYFSSGYVVFDLV